MARLPFALVSPDGGIPILFGCLRGKRWIANSAMHRCWLGLYEYEKQGLISREVQRNTVFYDVGANVGFYTLLASQLVGAGKVFAFEPVTRNLAYLEKHLALNHAENVEVLGLALSDTDGSAAFVTEATGFMGRLANDGETVVRSATLDHLLHQGRILPPNYIKMDIEGAELRALQGASSCIQQHRPVLFLATHGREEDAECRRLLELWGYDCQDIGIKSSAERGEIIAKFRVSGKQKRL